MLGASLEWSYAIKNEKFALTLLFGIVLNQLYVVIRWKFIWVGLNAIFGLEFHHLWNNHKRGYMSLFFMYFTKLLYVYHIGFNFPHSKVQIFLTCEGFWTYAFMATFPMPKLGDFLHVLWKSLLHSKKIWNLWIFLHVKYGALCRISWLKLHA